MTEVAEPRHGAARRGRAPNLMGRLDDCVGPALHLVNAVEIAAALEGYPGAPTRLSSRSTPAGRAGRARPERRATPLERPARPPGPIASALGPAPRARDGARAAQAGDRSHRSPSLHRFPRQGSASRGRRMTVDPILERVQALVTEVAGPERAPADADPDTPLGDSGYWLDSVDVLEVILACRARVSERLRGGADLTPERSTRREGSRSGPQQAYRRDRSPGFRLDPRSTLGALALIGRSIPFPGPGARRSYAKLFAAQASFGPAAPEGAGLAGHYPLADGVAGNWRSRAGAHHGRFLARQALLGIRTPEDLRRHVILKGEAH